MNLQQLQSMMSQNQNAEEKILEFRCGILNKKDDDMLYADKRKGYLSLHIKRQDQGTKCHITWKLRPSDEKILEIIVPKADAIIEKIPECNDGRVFVLLFKKSKRKYFLVSRTR